MSDAQSRQVLVIEPDAALRHVIALGLRRRGLDVMEARSLGELWERVAAPPAALVLDVGLDTTNEWVLLRTLQGHRTLREAPLVLLAWDCPAEMATTTNPLSASAHGGEDAPARICVAKPFDARALYAAVERLVAAPALVGAVAASAAGRQAGVEEQTQERQVVSGADPHVPRPAASISTWPLAAAGAATLAAVGFLIQPGFALVGVVALVAAVLWGCTANPEASPEAASV